MGGLGRFPFSTNILYALLSIVGMGIQAAPLSTTALYSSYSAHSWTACGQKGYILLRVGQTLGRQSHHGSNQQRRLFSPTNTIRLGLLLPYPAACRRHNGRRVHQQSDHEYPQQRRAGHAEQLLRNEDAGDPLCGIFSWQRATGTAVFLSLSLHLTGWASDIVSYGVYHYDFASGRRLTNAQVLDRFDIGEEDFVATLRCAAAQTHDAVYAPWGVPELSPDDENFGPMCIDLASVRAWTIAEENYELDSLRFYPEQDGGFTAFQPVGSLAGAGQCCEELHVQPGAKERHSSAPQSEYAFVTAHLTDDGAAVRFTRHEDGMFDSEEYRPFVGFSYNTDYPIAACYGEYQDIFVGTFGNGMAPYVFLLTKGGTVEYADIFGGFDNGFLCSGGPLYGLHDITDLKTASARGGYEEGYQTVYAVAQNGERYDLAGRITPMANAMPFPVTGDWYAEVRRGVDGGGAYTSSYFLSFQQKRLYEHRKLHGGYGGSVH